MSCSGVFDFFVRIVKGRAGFHPPVLITLCVLAVVFLIYFFPSSFPLQRIEWITFDWRMRIAAEQGANLATNKLGFVYFDDTTIETFMGDLFKKFGGPYGLYWPRHLYGRVVRELDRQGAAAIGFDVLFGEMRPDHDPLTTVAGDPVESDQFFIDRMKESGNVILAASPGLQPPTPFRQAAAALGNITSEADDDGILRRAAAFHDYRLWHPLIRKVARQEKWHLLEAREVDGALLFQGPTETFRLPVNKEGMFKVVDLIPESQSADREQEFKAYESMRVWHMGIVLAAAELGIDLGKAEVDSAKGQLILQGEGGLQRVIPVDQDHRFLIDWSMNYDDPRLAVAKMEKLVAADVMWEYTGSASEMNRFNGRLVLVGSTATGNDLTDLGATPLGKSTFLASHHWNVANSILLNRFIRTTPAALDLVLITLLGILAAYVTWKWKAVAAASLVLCVAVLYGWTAAWIFQESRIWMPIVLPVFGALLTTHVTLIGYKAVSEQNEKRRIRSVFSKLVSPEVVDEVLSAPRLSLGGARREVTVFFADIRGFTEMTDLEQSRTEEQIVSLGASATKAEQLHDQGAREVLETVNQYLSVVAETVKNHHGTLDKYIGDCVMAFWGAPTPDEHHALKCVRAAIDAQNAIAQLNQSRELENQRRKILNAEAQKSGHPLLPLLPNLSLGCGISTGPVIAGLMGSDSHILNYTVFGREVNLASRLEGFAERERIIISAATFQHLERDDPDLAGYCRVLPELHAKGIRQTVRAYEVMWKPKDKESESRNEPRHETTMNE